MPRAGLLRAGLLRAGLLLTGLLILGPVCSLGEVPASSRAELAMLQTVVGDAAVGDAAGAAADASPANDPPIEDSAWYDSETGRVIPVPVKPKQDDSLNRESRWLPKAERVKKQEADASATPTGGGSGGLFGSGLTLGNVFGWLLLVVIFAVGVGLLFYVVSKAEVDHSVPARSRRRGAGNEPDEQTVERMKHLPAELRRTGVDLRTEAERLMNEQLYDQAIILLFGHQLLLLDRAGLLRLNRGKTNRKYVRETRGADPALADRLSATVTAFEQSYFGRHEIGRDEFAELWRSNAVLEDAIARRREFAA